MQSVSMTTLVNNHSDLGWLCAYCTEEKRQKIQCSTRGREQILIWIKRVTLPFFVSCYLNCSLDLFGFENIPGGTHQNVQLSESSSNHCVLKLTHLWSFKVLTVKYLSISKMAIRSSRMTYSNDFWDPLTCPPASPAVWHFCILLNYPDSYWTDALKW